MWGYLRDTASADLPMSQLRENPNEYAHLMTQISAFSGYEMTLIKTINISGGAIA
jgi:hypothetical protein